MFCKQCGAPMDDLATACVKCAAVVEAPNPAGAVTDKVKAASKDSLQAFLKFATDPVRVCRSLMRALGVGVSFEAVFSLCVLLGTYRLIP